MCAPTPDGCALPYPVTYEFYRYSFGGGLGEAAFAECLPWASCFVEWLCLEKEPCGDELAFKRAICAAIDAFAEYGMGDVGGYTIGDFSVKSYENKGTTGEELATAAALKELAASGLAFSGVC